MANEILIGNICSLCAMASDSVSATRKKNSEILGIQILSQVFYGTGTILLKGYSSTAQNAVAILRNLAAMKNAKSKAVEWILVGLGVALGVVFNNRGLLGWMPIIANLEYSIAVFRFKDNTKGLKLAMIVNMLMYSVFSFFIQNYVGTVTNLVVAVTTAVSLLRDRAQTQPESGKAAPEEAEENKAE